MPTPNIKTFVGATVLTASDVNDYLMKQTVIYSSSTARPTSPQDGMTIYESDLDRYKSYHGGGWYWPRTIGVWNGSTAEGTFLGTSITTNRSYTLPDVDGTVITTGNLSSITAVGTLASGSIPATLLTGTIASGRLSGAYTGITDVGTLTSLTVDGASSPAVYVGDWSGGTSNSAIWSNSGHLILGFGSGLAVYLRTTTTSPVYIGANSSNTLQVGNGTVTSTGTFNATTSLSAPTTYGGSSYMTSSYVYSAGGSGQYMGPTSQTLISGTNQNGGIYLGGGTGSSATGGIEATWRDTLNPSIAIGVTRDGNKTMMVCSYADSTVRLYAANTEQVRVNTGGTFIDRYYGAIKYGSHGSISVYGTPASGWYGIVFPGEATTWMSAANGQYFGCYRNDTTWNFYVVNGTFVPSDARYKRDITPLNVGLGFIRELQPVSFDPLTEDPNDEPGTTVGRTHFGFTTQNILEALTAVGQSQDVALVDIGGPLGSDPAAPSDRQYLNHTGLLAPIVKAIQELDSRLQTLEAN